MKKQISIESLDKKVPFVVPEGYFNNLPMRVQGRVGNYQYAHEHSWRISWNWQRTVLASFCIGLIGALVWFTWPARQESIGQDVLSSVSDASIEQYLTDQNLTEYDLTEHTELRAPASDSAFVEQLNLSDDDIVRHIEQL